MYVILSIDGGGCKGLIAAEFLRNIYLNNPNFLDKVNCIVGVSSGSMVGGMIAAGITAEKILNIFQEGMKTIFKKQKKSICSCWGLNQPKYCNSVLWNTIYDVIGDSKFKDLKKDFICYSYDTKHSRPNIFINNTNCDENDILTSNNQDHYIIKNGNHSIADAIYQSCLAPTYFHNENGVIDGGIMSNNPTMIAVTIAHSYYKIPIEQIRVLSIGTKERIQVPLRNTKAIFFWIRNIINLLLNASVDHTKMLCDMLLGNRYLRIEVPCGLPIDSIKNSDMFIKMGHEAYITHKELIYKLFE